jgi:hypothetical protein
LLRFSTLTHGLSTMAFQCAASELSTNSAQNSRASVMICHTPAAQPRQTQFNVTNATKKTKNLV